MIENENEELKKMAYLYAVNMQRQTGKHLYYYLAKARAVVELIGKMKKGEASFTYLGQDGVIHRVKGTLIRHEKDFKKPYVINPESRFVLYYDTEIGAWRAFQAIGMEEVDN
jgi:hypothetical protein